MLCGILFYSFGARYMRMVHHSLQVITYRRVRSPLDEEERNFLDGVLTS